MCAIPLVTLHFYTYLLTSIFISEKTVYDVWEKKSFKSLNQNPNYNWRFSLILLSLKVIIYSKHISKGDLLYLCYISAKSQGVMLVKRDVRA